MKTNLTIKNFRVFDENGVTVELDPITILTGCNSSGKSSIAKAVFMLNSFLGQIKTDLDNNNPIKLNEYKIDFSTYPHYIVGGADRIIHAGSSVKKFVIEYTVYSLMLSKEVTVQLVFSPVPNDTLNDAFLDSISMSTTEGVFFSSSKENSSLFGKGNMHNYGIIKKDCLDFLQIDFLIHYFLGLCSGYQIDGVVSKEEYESEREKVFLMLREFDRNRLTDVVNHVYYAKPGFGNIIRKQKADYDVTIWSKEHGSLFMIPVLEKLDNTTKDQIWPMIEKEILKHDSNHITSIASKKIIDDFISSDFETFSEYFKSYEVIYLNRQEDRIIDGHLQYGDNPNISTGLGISQEYMLYDLRETVRGLCFGDEESGQEGNEESDALINTQEFEQWKNQTISFDMVYEIVMLWNEWAGYNTSENEKFYKDHVSFIGNTEYSHTMVQLFSTFVSELLKELVTPVWSKKLEYYSSSFVSVKRYYALEDNSDFSLLLKRYYEGKRAFSNSSDNNLYEIDSFMNKWVKRDDEKKTGFGLGDSVSIDRDKEGLGVVQVRLHHNPNDEGRLLADEGFGITYLVSIILKIETAILHSKKPIKNNWIGMDVFGKLINDDNKLEETTVVLEEPESHLHPKFHSLLADMMVEAYKKYNIHFIVETHSEYLIRKLQVLVAGKDDNSESQVGKDDISILYVDSLKDVTEKGEQQVRRIGIDEDGRLDSPFGTGFFDEADNLAMDLLKLKAK